MAALWKWNLAGEILLTLSLSACTNVNRMLTVSFSAGVVWPLAVMPAWPSAVMVPTWHGACPAINKHVSAWWSAVMVPAQPSTIMVLPGHHWTSMYYVLTYTWLLKFNVHYSLQSDDLNGNCLTFCVVLKSSTKVTFIKENCDFVWKLNDRRLRIGWIGLFVCIVNHVQSQNLLIDHTKLVVKWISCSKYLYKM